MEKGKRLKPFPIVLLTDLAGVAKSGQHGFHPKKFTVYLGRFL